MTEHHPDEHSETSELIELPPLRPAGSRMGGFLFRVILSATVLGASIQGAIFFGQTKAPDTHDKINVIIPAVQTEEVKKQENGLTFTVTGVVVPFREVPISPEVSGKISFLAENCRVGRYVRKGDVLLKIDPADYELALAQARQQATQAARSVVELDVSVTNAKRQIKIAGQQLEVQQRELVRVRELAKTEAISKTDLDTVLLGELTRQEVLQTLENQVRTLESQRERLGASKNLAEVAVEKAQLDLDRCTIYSPLDGVVVGLRAEEDKFAQRGESLVTIHDTSRLEVQASLYMKHVEWLWSARKTGNVSPENASLTEVSGTTAGNSTAAGNGAQRSDRIEVENGSAALSGHSRSASFPAAAETRDPLNYYQFAPTPVTIVYRLGETEYSWRGVLEYLDGPGLDSRTMMLPCRIVVNDPLDVTAENTKSETRLVDRPALLPGMFVRVKVHVVPRKTLLDISEMAILPGGTLWKVVDGKLKRSPVVTAQVQNQRVLVYEAPGVIEAGDWVVVSPLASPVEGATVEVMK